MAQSDVAPVMGLIARTGNSIMAADCNGVYHFNADFRNDAVMQEALDKLDADKKPTTEEREALSALYEKTFNHRSFTGRSTTFFAYEGLGSIYWHMVSKLLLAVQENIFMAIEAGDAGQVHFTLCGVPVTYHAGTEKTVVVHKAGALSLPRQGDTLSKDETRALFRRDGSIKGIDVTWK